MFKIEKDGQWLTTDGKFVRDAEQAHVFETFEHAASLKVGQIIELDLPVYTLMGLDAEDCFTVICHWHVNPTAQDISEMINTTSGEYLYFTLSEMKSRHQRTLQ